MTKAIFFSINIVLSFSMTAQKLNLHGCLNYSNVSMDYYYFSDPNTSIPFFQKDLFSEGYIGYGLSGGVEFFDENRTTILLQIQYNKLGGKLGGDSYSQYGKTELGLIDKFTLNQLSINPIIKFKLINQDKWNLNLLSGLKFDYNLSHSNISSFNSSFLNINDKLKEQMNTLGLSINFGIGGEINLTDKLSLQSNLMYNRHLTNLTNRDIHTSTGGAYIFSSLNFIQFQTGIAYKL